MKSGEITEEEAKRHPQKKYCYSVFGITLCPNRFCTCDFKKKNEDTILLCSDRLSNMLEDQYIKEILGNYSDVNTQAQKSGLSC